MARRTISDVVERWHDNHSGGYGLHDAAVEHLLSDLMRAGFCLVRVVTPDDLAGDDD